MAVFPSVRETADCQGATGLVNCAVNDMRYITSAPSMNNMNYVIETAQLLSLSENNVHSTFQVLQAFVITDFVSLNDKKKKHM